MEAKRMLTVLGLIVVLLGACIPAPLAAPTQVQGDQAGTALVQTFDAFQTESAQTLVAVEQTRNAVTATTLLVTPSLSSEAPTPTLSETPTAIYTSTPSSDSSTPTELTPTETATGTSAPTSSGAAGCDWAAFVEDVTIPDGTTLNPGEIFTKTWRLRNRGSCTWTTDYQLVFYSGTQFGNTTAVNLPRNVSPQQTVDISVTLTAPNTGGHFFSYWMLRNPAGGLFGYGAAADRPVYVEINTTGNPVATATGDVRVSVSVDTNCRSGPGAAYTYLGALLVGESAEVVGRNAEWTYWIIRNPDQPGTTCWLWGQYASVSGNSYGLPVYSAPGWTPLPSSGVTVTVSVDTNCRSGPGAAYSYQGVLLVGESAEVIGRNAEWTYWIIRNPDQPGGTCWLWGQYTSVSGDVYSLPIYGLPGAPTPQYQTPPASGVRVSVWVDTNCRSGPGAAYTYLGALLVGESTEVLGRNAAWTYWIVRNPDQPGGTCWLWGQYATLSGNPTGLPVYSTPTLLTATPTYTVSGVATPTGATRITFEAGSIGTTIKADLPENKLHTYVLRAEAGQTMTVQLNSKWDLLLSISGADGSVLKSSGIAGSEWSGTLPRSQDYYLAIQAVDGLAASYTLQIVIPAK